MAVYYGSATADAALTTACDFATVSGGTETSKVTTNTGTGNYMEVTSNGLSVACQSSIPNPTGNGWVISPGSGTFAQNNWSASITLANTAANGVWTLRFLVYKASTASYSSIGTITASITATAKTTYTFSSTSMPNAQLHSADLLYVDLWYQDLSGAAGDTVTVYVGSASTAGVANDVQITTSTFTSTVFTSTQDTFATSGRGILNAWSPGSSDDNWAQQRGNQTLSFTGSQGKLTYTSNTNTGIVTYTGLTATDIEVSCNVTQNDGNSEIVGVAARYQNTNNFYFACIGATAGTFEVRMDHNGTFSSIGSAPFTSSFGTKYTVKLHIKGSTIQAKIWQTGTSEPTSWTIAPFTDTTFSSGLFGVAGAPTGGGSISFDQFNANNLAKQPVLGYAPRYIPRGVSALIHQPLRPINIPRYVPRGILSTIATYTNNIATRFKLANVRDVPIRFRLMSANQLKDVATRFKLSKFVDIASRFRLAKLNDVPARLRLMSANQLRDVTTRLRLANLKDVPTRFSLGRLRDVATRIRLMSANQLRDVSTRLRLGSVRDVVARLRLAKLNDIATRFNLSVSSQVLRDIVSRFRLAKLNDVTNRFRLAKLNDVAVRFRVMSANQLHDVAARLRLANLRDVPARFRLGSLKDLSTRLKLANLKDMALRFRLASLNDIAVRFRLIGPRLRDVTTRFNLAKLNDMSTRFRLARLQDVSTRFRIRSANQLHDLATRFQLANLKDVSTRLRLAKLNDIATRFILAVSVGRSKDIATRFNLVVLRVKDVATRFRLASVRDISSRFRIMQQKSVDVVVRLRLQSANQLRDVSSRFRLASLRDTPARFRLGTLRDVAARFRIKSASNLHDIATRVTIAQLVAKDIAARLRLMGVQNKDVATRFKLSKFSYLASRFRLGSLRDVTTRFRQQSSSQPHDLTTRFVLQLTNAPIGMLVERTVSLLYGSETVKQSSLTEVVVALLQATHKTTIQGSTEMPTPNTSIQSTVTATDVNNALVPNLQTCNVTVRFPDGSTQQLSLGSGVTNLGAGLYQAKYNSKGVGVMTENWSVVASDGVTVGNFQFDIGVGY